MVEGGGSFGFLNEAAFTFRISDFFRRQRVKSNNAVETDVATFPYTPMPPSLSLSRISKWPIVCPIIYLGLNDDNGFYRRLLRLSRELVPVCDVGFCEVDVVLSVGSATLPGPN